LVGRNQPIAPSDNTTAKDVLNLLLDEWDGQGLALPLFDTDIQFNTVANTARYFLGEGPEAEVYAVRPEKIITGTVTISTGPTVRMTMRPMDFQQYTMIAVPGTTGQPWNFAINETWPQMELYLYPTPSQVFPITLNCKIKWVTTTGEPNDDLMATVKIPSGYVAALVDNLALRIAQVYRLDTETMENKAAAGRFSLASKVAHQIPPDNATLPLGLFPWNTGISGRNP
jgi:hypothetical protein